VAANLKLMISYNADDGFLAGACYYDTGTGKLRFDILDVSCPSVRA
jgi:hypothetical protein